MITMLWDHIHFPGLSQIMDDLYLPCMNPYLFRILFLHSERSISKHTEKNLAHDPGIPSRLVWIVLSFGTMRS